MKHAKQKTESGKHIPLRTCIVCRSVKPKDELLAVYALSEEGRKGKGAYLCNCRECVEKAIKTRAFNRVMRQAVKNSIYQELEEISFERS